MNQGASILDRLRQRPSGLVSAAALGMLLVGVIFWPLITAYPPEALSDLQFAPPSREHWFGTDVHGRDLLSRVCYGTRVSLLIGLVGAGVSLIIGVLWGTSAAWLGGRWDNLMMRIVDIFYSLPSVVFVVVIITTLEGLFKGWLARFSPDLAGYARFIFLFAGLGSVSWLNMARIVRGQVLSLKERQFIDASRVLGAGWWHIFRRHIFPNIRGIVIVYLMLSIPAVILYESFLSYLGLGIQPPQASLGSLISEGANQINPIRIYWWIVLFPSLALVTALLALNTLGDALRAE